MKIYLNCTANLGDFVQSLPVLSGIAKEYGKIDFVIRKDMEKFNGIKEFLMYQGLFNSVEFDEDIFLYGSEIIILSSWTREDKAEINRPIETCRYENWLKDRYNLKFEVDDTFTIKYPQFDIEVDQTKPYCGDRWNGPSIDDRREVGVLSHLQDVNFLDYNNCILKNCYIVGESKHPFITNFTGIGMIADLMFKETLVVWKAEDWKPEFRVGDNISWDNGKDINKIFEKHFYLNRKSKLVHAKDLEKFV